MIKHFEIRATLDDDVDLNQAMKALSGLMEARISKSNQTGWTESKAVSAFEIVDRKLTLSIACVENAIGEE